MSNIETDPSALYVHCDAAMSYNSQSTGGVGYCFSAPENSDLDGISKSFGKYTKYNIETLELTAINEAMKCVLHRYQLNPDVFKNLTQIVFITDRFHISDQERTNPYTITKWRKNHWRNYQNKPIKNSEILDIIDKNRTKLIKNLHYHIGISYVSRKYNKKTDKLAKDGKKVFSVKSANKQSVKVGKRLYNGGEIIYSGLCGNDKLVLCPYLKQFVKDMWEIRAEICKGTNKGQTVTIYTDTHTERSFHRNHYYTVIIDKVFSNYITISANLLENCNITRGSIQ